MRPQRPRRIARLLLLASVPTMLTIHYIWRLISDGAKPFDWLALALSLFAEGIVIWLIAYEIRTPKREQLARRKLLTRTFELRLSEGSRIQANASLGASVNIPFAIYLAHPTIVSRFNLRFVQRVSDGTFQNVDPKVIRIKRVYSIHGALFHDEDGDGEGGCNGWFPDQQMKFYAGTEMRLQLEIIAPRPWAGFLSFQGFDADDERQYARHEFAAIEPTPPASETQVQ